MKTPRGEITRCVGAYLAQHPSASSVEIQKHCGYPYSSVAAAAAKIRKQTGASPSVNKANGKLSNIDDAVMKIRGHVFDAGKAEQTCAKHRLQAGWKLLDLRKRIEDGEEGKVDWWEWYKSKFTGHIESQKQAEKLMQWAEENSRESDSDKPVLDHFESLRPNKRRHLLQQLNEKYRE